MKYKVMRMGGKVCEIRIEGRKLEEGKTRDRMSNRTSLFCPGVQARTTGIVRHRDHAVRVDSR